ncbi:alpha-amylase [Rubrivivax gelatinosus]|nr:alpha-amylase [Rubrivivax gelatinosus]
MHSSARAFRLLAIAAAAASLIACGGGGGGSGAALPTVDTSSVAPADPGSVLAEGWQRRGIAQIFVRSYQDSDGDGKGDLQGLISRLDYLKALGVGGIWLMPITASQDQDHGYAVKDYRAVESDYGSLADLDALVAAAHARGLGVIVDYVMNHSAAEHPAFLNSRAGASNNFRSWYVWQDSHPSGWSIYGSDPWRAYRSDWYYAPFWDQMPDFDLTNAAVVAWHHDNLRFWLNRGVDGFRFDAVGNLVENGASAWENQPQNHVLMADVRSLVGGYARRYMVCEGPSDPAGYAASCGSAFAFGHQSDLIAAAKGDTAAIAAVAAYPSTAPAGAATFLSNHDSFAGQRPWDQLSGNVAQYKLAAATYLLQPGVPFVYYGEEIGMAGASSLSGDPKLRTPMSWTAAGGFTNGTPYRTKSANVDGQNVAVEEADADSLLNFYKAMLALRGTRPSISAGDYLQPAASGTLLSFQRMQGSERTLVVLNYGSTGATATVTGLPANATLASLYPSGGSGASASAAGQASITMAARSVRVFDLR